MNIKLIVYCIAAFVGVANVLAEEESTFTRIDGINTAFLMHLDAMEATHRREVATVKDLWTSQYREMPTAFVPDALTVLYPAFAEALAAFDRDDLPAAEKRFAELADSDDYFLAANATYFLYRTRVLLGDREAVQASLEAVLDKETHYSELTPYWPHLVYIKGVCEWSNLAFDQSKETLSELLAEFPDMPEGVRVGARQLLLEIERREDTPMGEVRDLMEYSASRLKIADVGDKVQERQATAIGILDDMIEKAKEQESQCNKSGGAGGGKGGKKSSPSNPAEKSTDEMGEGGGDNIQHMAPKATPGEEWGKLPPIEREKILQSLRERFSARYRQLVEQYYRALAEEK